MVTTYSNYSYLLTTILLYLRLPVTNILARKRRSPEDDYSLPSPLVGSWNGSDIDGTDDEEYFNFYGDGNEPIEEEEVGQEQRDEIEGLPREVYCDLATTLRDRENFSY